MSGPPRNAAAADSAAETERRAETGEELGQHMRADTVNPLCKIRTTQPERFTINPAQHNVGPNIYPSP